MKDTYFDPIKVNFTIQKEASEDSPWAISNYIEFPRTVKMNETIYIDDLNNQVLIPFYPYAPIDPKIIKGFNLEPYKLPVDSVAISHFIKDKTCQTLNLKPPRSVSALSRLWKHL